VTNRPIKRIRVLHGSEVVKRQGLAQRQVAGGVTGGLARTKPTIPIATPGGGDAGEGGEGLAYIGEDDDRLTLTPAMAGSTVLFQLSYVPVDETLDLRIHYGGTAADDGGLLDPSLYTVTEDGVVKIAWQSAWGLALGAGLTLELSARYLREEGAEPEAYDPPLAFRGGVSHGGSIMVTQLALPAAAQIGDLLVVEAMCSGGVTLADPRLAPFGEHSGTGGLWAGTLTSLDPLLVTIGSVGGAAGNAVRQAAFYDPDPDGDSEGTWVVTEIATTAMDWQASMPVPATSHGATILGARSAGGIGGASLSGTVAGYTNDGIADGAYSRAGIWHQTSDSGSPATTVANDWGTDSMGYTLIAVERLTS